MSAEIIYQENRPDLAASMRIYGVDQGNRVTLASRLDGGPEYTMTNREFEVLTLKLQTQSTKQIASALGITPGTVRDHSTSIFSSLNVKDSTGTSLRLTLVKLVKEGIVEFMPRINEADTPIARLDKTKVRP